MPKNPHADFTPTLAGYSGITPFRFWCQTALPLTYDDSLSYYELLNKVVNYLNHTIEDLTNVENNTSELAEAYEKLQKYVNDYFDDLDIEAELRTVLDGMAEDGTLDTLLNPLVANRLPGVVENQISDVVAEQIDNTVENQLGGVVGQQLPPLVDANIGGEVSEWLENNVDPVGSAVVVDKTLSISGAAADAKVAGDEIGDLKTRISPLYNDYIDSLPWVIGGVATGEFIVIENLKRICNSEIIEKTDGGFNLTADEGFEFSMLFYNDDGTYRTNSGWLSEYAYTGRYNYVIRVKRVSGETNLADVNELLKHLHSDYKVGIIPDIEKDVDELKEKTNDIDILNRLKPLAIQVPEYAETEFESVLEKLFTNLENTPVIFGFNTDQHITYGEENEKRVGYGLSMLSKMTRFIPMQFIALGGDAAGYGYENDGPNSTIKEILEDVNAVNMPVFDAWCPVIHISGNHDAFQNLESNNRSALTGAQIYNNYIKRANEMGYLTAYSANTCNCYIDDENNEIRYIFIDDSKPRTPTKTWLFNTAIQTAPQNYNFIIISHHCLSNNIESAGFSGGWGWQADLEVYGTRIIVCVSGHAHKDGASYDGGILYVQTDCAMAGPNNSSGYDRPLDTADETSFDVFMVDTTNKYIYAIRYGAGNDRTFIYEGNNAGQIT